MVVTLKELEKNRSVLRKRIIKTQSNVNGWDPSLVSLEEVELALAELSTQKDKVEELYDLTGNLVDEADFPPHEKDFDVLFNGLKVLQVKAMALQTLKKKAVPSSVPSFKLDRIKLPQFSGQFSNWQSFHDIFVTSVHHNTSLSGAEKMIHLKSCLTDDAASIVSSFQTSEANYVEAWALVNKRFSNQRELVFSHLKKFDELKLVQSESASGLRNVSDTVNECVRSLKVLKIPVEHWVLILIYYSMKKLDQETKKQWSLKQTSNLPTLADFIEFVESRARALSDSSLTSYKCKINQPERSKSASAHHSSSPTSSISCIKCSESHHLHQCPIFSHLPISDRKSFVSQHRLCFNCLFKGHSVLQCRMKFVCKKCGQKHSSLLHTEPQSVSNPAPSPNLNPNPLSSTVSSSATLNTDTNSINNNVVSSHCIPESNSGIVLLCTILVSVADSTGEKQICRVFVDSGSESHFMSERCVDMLGIRRKHACVSITGIGEVAGEPATGIVNIKLHSLVSNFTMDISALVIRKITGFLPRAPCKSNWSHLKGMVLSDPTFYKPGTVDILLGAKASASIMLPGLVEGPVGSPTAQNTHFGWMLSGEVNKASHVSRQVISHHVSCHIDAECVQDTLKRFWELEEPESYEIPLSSEDSECESHFVSTHQRNSKGNYTVELPFKKNCPNLGNSRAAAVKRFNRLESRFNSQPAIWNHYVRCMRESIASEFMELVPQDDLSKSTEESYYMPHTVVIKDSTTTKYRIVFDASAKTTTGVSLNDVLLTGPKLQVDLVPLFIRFRSHIVAISADIWKFYHQYYVHNKHVDFQRFLWRESPQDPISDYRMSRVTFGVTTAPYLAIRCLHHLADEEKHSSPSAARVIKEDFLVDNLLSGAADIESAIILQREILHVMKKGNLQLRKWTSNCMEILENIPEDQRESKGSLPIQEDELIKTIGLQWKPSTDTFGVSIVAPPSTILSSKRKVLSSIAKIFDPLGWLSPVTIRPKIMMQELWKAKLDWDTALPNQLHNQWINYCQELETLKLFEINRCILQPPNSSSQNCKHELHGFSDASKTAYSACVYIRTIDEARHSSVQLVAAKTKVAPVQMETIPRLELCGGVLFAKLMKVVQDSVKVEFRVIRCWTDSKIVLGWLSKAEKLPVFVANRVYKIQAISPHNEWCHVKGEDNPADCSSRGISASSLINHHLWFHGPAWLETATFPMNQILCNTAATTLEPSQISKFIRNCSSFTRMKRVIAFCFRFLHNSRLKIIDRRSGRLSVGELSTALNSIILCVQSEAFGPEIIRCKKKEVVKSSIKFLTPFLDSSGILRVGGRIQKSSLSYGQKHPVLLPRYHNVTEQIVLYYHLYHLHAAPLLLLAAVRDQFWIIRGPHVAKKIVRRCVICHRHNAESVSQLMGQLPSSRVTPSRTFSQCGVDYAGPFMLTLRVGRNPIITKSYVSVFVCMSTRAIHLELVSDLSTPAFIGALIRFISRRGLPADIYSDGGKNFEGAKNEIQDFMKFVKSNAHLDSVTSFLADKGIQFHMNPPLSPHHGGLWEAAVKSMKHHIKRIVENRKFSIEEFSTLLTQVEACLNSRPLTQMTSDPNDFSVLTPGHFIIGESLTALPQHDLTHLQQNRLSRWQAVHQAFQHFWRRWQSEYLTLLQTRHKWFAAQPNLEVGVLVLIRDDDIAWGPLKWKLGRVIKAYPGDDEKIRVYDVITSTGAVFKRPIVKLCPLPIYE